MRLVQNFPRESQEMVFVVRSTRAWTRDVLDILARQRQPAPPADIPTPKDLQLRHQPVADC